MATKKKNTADDFETETPYTKNETVTFNIEIRKNTGEILFKANKKYPVVYETTHVYRLYSEIGDLYFMPKDYTRMTVE